MDNLWVGAYEEKTFENHITGVSDKSGKKFALKMVTHVASGDVVYNVVSANEIVFTSSTLGESLQHLKKRREGFYETHTIDCL